MTTISPASRAGRGLPVPGAFPRAGARPATGIDGANGVWGATGVNEAAITRRPTAGTCPFLGQALAQPTHVYRNLARMDARKRNAAGSQPWRAPD